MDYKIEIILNRAVSENLLEYLSGMDIKHYTLMESVHGFGEQGGKLGDAVWPEENDYFILYVSEQNKRVLKIIIDELRERFPEVGIYMVAIPCQIMN